MSLIGSSGPFTQPKSLSSWLVWEVNREYTRRPRTLLGGVGGARTVLSATIVAAMLLGAPTVTPGAAVSGSGGVPGNGDIGVVTADVGAPEGIYHVRILNPAANAGAFEVIRPDGQVDGNGTVGVAYNGAINFTLADGATDFVEDDRIPVSVTYAVGSKKVVAWDPEGVNGAQTPCGIALYDTVAPEGVDVDILVLEDMSLVNADELNWPEGVTADEKAAAWETLLAIGIKPTTGNG